MWKDTTSYCLSDKERVPTAFTIKTKNLRITVTCGHIHHKGDWIMHCPQLGISCLNLASSSLDEAKASSIHVVKETLKQLTNEIGSAV